MTASTDLRKRILRLYNKLMFAIGAVVAMLATDPHYLLALGRWGGPATLCIVILNAAINGWAHKRPEGE